MEFPTYEEMGQEVANRALDEYEYKGKTLREWVEIISAIPVTAIPATDTNVCTKLGTNLAEVGTDCISRQAAIDAARDWYEGLICGSFKGLEKRLRSLPPVQSEPKRGKWIDKGWTGDWQYLTDGRGDCWRNIVCSECGESVRHESNFCPNCGVKMEVTT